MRTLTYLITFCLLIISSQVYSQNFCDAGFLTAEVSNTTGCASLDGSIDLTLTGGTGPFTFEWFGSNVFGVTTEDLSDLMGGFYNVIITDANGESCSKWFEIEGGSPICSATISNLTCDGENSIAVTCRNGVSPYTYLWSNGETSSGINDLLPGTYAITVTDANGCEMIEVYTISQNPNVACDTVFINPVQVTSGNQIRVDFVVNRFQDILSLQYTIAYDPTKLQYASVGNFPSETNGLTENSFGNVQPGLLTFSWFDSALSGVDLPDGSSIYSVFFNALSTESSEISITNSPTAIEASNKDFNTISVIVGSTNIIAEGNQLTGSIYRDLDGNCENDEEPAIANWFLNITDETDQWNIVSTNEGTFSIVLPDGTYDVAVTPINENWDLCNNDITIDVNGDVTQDFGAVALVDCSVMEVDMAIPRLIRCFNNKIFVNYCNNGTRTADNAYVEIELDSEMSYLSSEITPTNVNGNTMTFELGDVEIGACDDFAITVLLDDGCDSSTLGQTHCTTATIFPNVPCVSADPLWDGSSLEVTGSCDGENVVFVIENIGTESMTQASSFIVIEDHVMGQSIPEDFMLAAGETVTITEPANGSTYYMSVAQVANHPGNSNPSIAIEGCGRNSNGEFSLGVVTQYNQDDNDGFVDVECVQNVGSYDPNDKAAMLKGFGTENNIYANTPMEYMIRFQNTGTFTAFNVVVEDELSPNFDITSLRVGASSHDYIFSIEDERKLIFTFENINLPDSTADLAGSNGFLTYKVNQLLDLEDGTVLENTADIFFDFNEAIVTNTTSHTIGSDFISFSTFVDNELGQENSISIFPNPATDKITFELEKLSENLALEVYDLAGRLIYNNSFSNEKIVLSKNELEEGMYFYSILSKGNQVESGKFVFQ